MPEPLDFDTIAAEHADCVAHETHYCACHTGLGYVLALAREQAARIDDLEQDLRINPGVMVNHDDPYVHRRQMRELKARLRAQAAKIQRLQDVIVDRLVG